MQLECKIQNTNSESFCNLKIKKLRQVIFINRNEIDVYTALLTGGNGDESFMQNISELADNFRLEVTFRVKDNAADTNIIEVENQINDFCEELDKITPLWGECKEVGNQAELSKYLGEILGKSVKIDRNLSKIKNGEKYLYLEKEKCISCAGVVNPMDNGYGVYVPRTWHKGIDCISWVKTSIKLTKRISAKEGFVFKLTLPTDEKSKCLLDYLSVYICPPESYHILEDSSVWILFRDGKSTKDKKNNLTLATKNEAIYYDEWLDRQDILNRNVYRINKEKLLDGSPAPYECKSMDMAVSLVSDMERGSMQFVLGAVYSAIVTYGVDSGRLAEIKGCMGPALPPDIQWYFLCVVAFWAFIRWCSRKDKVKMKIWDKIAMGFLIVGSAMMAIWLVFTFVIFRIETEWAKALVASLPSQIAVCTFNGALILITLYIIMTHTIIRSHYAKRPISKDIVF